jgi:hypothetical protein
MYDLDLFNSEETTIYVLFYYFSINTKKIEWVVLAYLKIKRKCRGCITCGWMSIIASFFQHLHDMILKSCSNAHN